MLSTVVKSNKSRNSMDDIKFWWMFPTIWEMRQLKQLAPLPVSSMDCLGWIISKKNLVLEVQEPGTVHNITRNETIWYNKATQIHYEPQVNVLTEHV